MHVLDQKNLAEGTLAHHLHDYEILKLDHMSVFLLTREYEPATFPHTSPGGWLSFYWTALFVLVFIFIIFIKFLLQALLKLLVSDL